MSGSHPPTPPTGTSLPPKAASEPPDQQKPPDQQEPTDQQGTVGPSGPRGSNTTAVLATLVAGTNYVMSTDSFVASAYASCLVTSSIQLFPATAMPAEETQIYFRTALSSNSLSSDDGVIGQYRTSARLSAVDDTVSGDQHLGWADHPVRCISGQRGERSRRRLSVCSNLVLLQLRPGQANRRQPSQHARWRRSDSGAGILRRCPSSRQIQGAVGIAFVARSSQTR